MMLFLGACGNAVPETPEPETEPVTFEETQIPVTDPREETAEDLEIDFSAQYALIPDLVGWLYAADAGIDTPVVQSEEDGYYRSHDAHGDDAPQGAVYLETGADEDLMDPVSIVTGSAEADGALNGLMNYAEPEFFEQHEKLQYCHPYGPLTYTVIAAWEEEKGADEALFAADAAFDGILGEITAKAMGKNLRRERAEHTGAGDRLLVLRGNVSDGTRCYIVAGVLEGIEE